MALPSPAHRAAEYAGRTGKEIAEAVDNDTRAILLAFSVAPLAVGCVFTVLPPLALFVIAACDVPVERPAGLLMLPIVGWLVLTPGAYLACWIFAVPGAMLLRIKGWLTARVVFGVSAIVPTAGAAVVALFASEPRGENVLPAFLYVAFHFVPATLAVAATFWRIYSFLTGRQFLGGPSKL